MSDAPVADAAAASPDFLSEDGAKELARRIDVFWRRKLVRMGVNPAIVWVRVEKEGHFGRGDKGRPVYAVRSNLLGGLPRLQLGAPS